MSRPPSRPGCTGWALAVLSVLAVFAIPQSAFAFGTITGLGQHSEHERITRLALQCGLGQQPPDCFQPVSLDNLAGGRRGSFGAVGAADNLPLHAFIDREYWHCDNADWVNPTLYNIASYPRSRHEALDTLRECLSWGKAKLFDGGGNWSYPPFTPDTGAVATAAQLVSASGKVDASNPGVGPFSSTCTFDGTKGRPKCNVLEPFGYLLHMSEDFYSHTNWADFSAPGEPLSLGNPYGLGNSEIAPFLDLRGPLPSDDEIPANFTGGCYPTSKCAGRVIHGTSSTDRGLNKDKGIINTTTGQVTDPGTPRGAIVVDGVSNVQRAVNLAVLDTRRQWEVLRAELVRRYGFDRGSKMVCALVLDHSETCEKRNVVLAVDTSPPRRGAAVRVDRATVDAGDALLDQLGDEDSVAVVSFDDLKGTVDVDDFTAPDRANIGDPLAGDAAPDPALKVEPEDNSDPDPTVTPKPENPVEIPPPPGTVTSGTEEGEEAAEEATASSVASTPRPPRSGAVRALRAATALLVDDDTPRGQRGVVIVTRKATADHRLAARIRALGRRGAYVSLALLGSPEAPVGIVRAVERTGGTVVATPRPGALRRFVALADDAGLTRLDDALPEEGAPLDLGNPAFIGVVGDGAEVHPIGTPGRRELLKVDAVNRSLSLLVTDHAAGVERRLRVVRGRAAEVTLRPGGDYDVAVDGQANSEYLAAITTHR